MEVRKEGDISEVKFMLILLDFLLRDEFQFIRDDYGLGCLLLPTPYEKDNV